MNPIVANQGRTFLKLWETVRPLARSDRNFPEALRKVLAAEKRFGSRDRRLYRELNYTAVRHLPWIEAAAAVSESRLLETVLWLTGDHPLTAPLREGLLGSWPALPGTLAERATQLGTKVGDLVPDWFGEEVMEGEAETLLDALHTRASLWLRIPVRHQAAVQKEFETQGWPLRRAPNLETAFEVLKEVDVTQSASFENGLFEVQDLGSQRILGSLQPLPEGRWLDACAGAGGKTLQLSELLGEKGSINATDIRPGALNELEERRRRTTSRNIRIVRQTAGLAADYDVVLVDAPCSGSGTWRRSPHLKWQTPRAQLAGDAERQLQILGQQAARVRSGGLLVYATCSLFRSENEGVRDRFLKQYPTFAPASCLGTGKASLLISPEIGGGDGFYVAAFRKA